MGAGTQHTFHLFFLHKKSEKKNNQEKERGWRQRALYRHFFFGCVIYTSTKHPPPSPYTHTLTVASLLVFFLLTILHALYRSFFVPLDLQFRLSIEKECGDCGDDEEDAEEEEELERA